MKKWILQGLAFAGAVALVATVTVTTAAALQDGSQGANGLPGVFAGRAAAVDAPAGGGLRITVLPAVEPAESEEAEQGAAGDTEAYGGATTAPETGDRVPDSDTEATREPLSRFTSQSTMNPWTTWHVISNTLSASVSVQEAGALITGVTYEVICEPMIGVNVTAFLEGVKKGSIESDDEHGYYTLGLPEVGVYEVVATMAGFRPQTREITIEDPEEQYELHFRGDHGLVPNAPTVFYVLQVVNVWLYPPDEECELSVFKVLEVVNAWLYPIEED